jgi:hypothetical protein
LNTVRTVREESGRRTFVKSSVLKVGTLALLACGLLYCSFGPEEYNGPWPEEPPPEMDAGGGTDDGGGATDDGGGATDDGGGATDDGGGSTDDGGGSTDDGGGAGDAAAE